MRPLPNRLNVIISTTLNNLNDCDLYENADSEKIVLSRVTKFRRLKIF